MKSLHTVSFVLLVAGGLNWLLVGLFGGQEALISRIVYVLVGLAAINEVAIHRSICKVCSGEIK